jgi:hypothetical protein
LIIFTIIDRLLIYIFIKEALYLPIYLSSSTPPFYFFVRFVHLHFTCIKKKQQKLDLKAIFERESVFRGVFTFTSTHGVKLNLLLILNKKKNTCVIHTRLLNTIELPKIGSFI